MKTFVCILMAALMSNIPHVAFGEVADKMIPTMVVVNEMSRAESEQNILEVVSRDEISLELEKLRLSKDEVTKRIAALSDSEIRDLSKQIDEARYGGITGILVTVVLVLLIIYLAKRI